MSQKVFPVSAVIFWVTSLVGDNSSLGLYFHIPFCHQKCHYCDFLISVHHQEHRSQFLKTLKKQIQFVAPQYQGRRIGTLYFGGGTPSLLRLEEIQEIFEEVSLFFRIETDAEITFEANPDDMSKNYAKGLKSLGITRLSLGLQSFDDQILKQLGRCHDLETTKNMLRMLQQQSFPNLSFDLMLGIPGQTNKQWEETLTLALNYAPQHFSIYDLEIQPKTYFDYLLKHQKIKSSPEGTTVLMAQRAEEWLTQAGYRQYELASFALPGYECRHNLRYWNHEPYLGFGPSAYSYIENERFQWDSSIFRFYEKGEKGCWSKDFSEVLPVKTQEKETLITQIRLDHGLDLKKIGSLKESIAETLEKMKHEKLLEVNHEIVKLTAQGRQLYEKIVEELLSSV